MRLRPTMMQAKTLLMIAILRGDDEMVHLLVDNDADINARCHYGMTALMYAAQYGNTISSKEIIRFLVSRGANVNAKTNTGLTAIMYAC